MTRLNSNLKRKINQTKKYLNQRENIKAIKLLEDILDTHPLNAEGWL